MNILINDFGGYAFIVQLSRVLAKTGHDVTHCYCGSLSTTPQGPLLPAQGDSATLNLHPITLRQTLDKYSLVKRRGQEIEYGQQVAQLVSRSDFEVVVSANTPLDALRYIWAAAEAKGSKKVFWLQDIIGIATKRILGAKLPVLGHLVGHYYSSLERRLLRRADKVIAISEDFIKQLRAMQLDESKVAVVENWAPLEDIPLLARENQWSIERDLVGRFVFLYSGTLSLKHNPALLLQLASALVGTNGVVVVRSQGAGADWLKANVTEQSRPHLIVEPYGAYADLPRALAAADVLVALLEPAASEFSVPSKVLSYLCAGRALLLSVPEDNLVAKLVAREGAGRVVAPANGEAEFCNVGIELMENPEICRQFGASARAYAERTFGIDGVTDRFLAAIGQAI